MMKNTDQEKTLEEVSKLVQRIRAPRDVKWAFHYKDAYMCIVEDYLHYLHILHVIKTYELKGCKFVKGTTTVKVDSHGNCQWYPDNFFDETNNALMKLI